MRNKFLKYINSILFLVFVIITILFIIEYMRNDAYKKRLFFYEMYKGEDTSEILKVIIEKEMSQGRLKISKHNQMEIQYYPYIRSPYQIQAIDTSFYFFSERIHNFETQQNRFNFLQFKLHRDNSADIVYFIGDQKVHARLKKHKSWEITKFINYKKSN
jgi:hypothetical protein